MSEKKKLPSLDSVRGVAIILVIIAHFMIARFPFAGPIGLACANGGVMLFFFLSGFLMDRTFGAAPNLPTYVLRRSFRILPMYWLSIALIYFFEGRWSGSDALLNATFTAPLFHVERMSGVYWTLYVEVLFYALVPIVFALGTRAIIASTYVVAVLFAAIFLARGPMSWALFYIIYCFAGMQIGAWSRGAMSGKVLSTSMLAVALTSSLLPIVSPYLGIAPLACCALMCIAVRRPFKSPVLELCGKASYSWYLLHPIFGYLMRDYMLGLGLSDWIAALSGAFVTLGLSVATLYAIERPCITIGKKIAQLTLAPLPRTTLAPAQGFSRLEIESNARSDTI